MQIQDDKVFCSVAAKWKNLIKGYAWTTRPHKTFNILQDQIPKLKFIHNFTITHTSTNRCFPFHLSPFMLFSPFSQLKVNVKTGQYYIPTPGSAFTQQITERKHRVIKHAIQGSPLLLHLVIMGDAQVTANWITCNTPRPSQRPSEPPTLAGRPV